MHHRHKQMAVPDSNTIYPAVLQLGNEPSQGALTLVHVAASTAVIADSKTHLHMNQLDRAMGMAMIMCFVRFIMM